MLAMQEQLQVNASSDRPNAKLPCTLAGPSQTANPETQWVVEFDSRQGRGTNLSDCVDLSAFDKGGSTH